MQNITNYSHVYNLGHELKYVSFKGFIYSQGTQQLVVKGTQETLNMNAKLPSIGLHVKSSYNTKP